MSDLIKILVIAFWTCIYLGINTAEADLVLNEMMAINNVTIADEFGEYDDWIEIFNTGPDSINLDGMNLTDDLSNPQAYTFPDYTLNSGEYLIIWTDDDIEQGDFHAGFKLSSGGESVYLLDGGVILDDTIFGTMGADLSWGRWPDGTGDWKILGTATPGEENNDDTPTIYAITLNEIMADNFSTVEDPEEPGEFPDWIELYNDESFSVDLGGMYLSDDPTDPTKFSIPSGVTVPANGYIVFWADNESDQGVQHTNFKLSSSGETITLYQGAVLVDSTEYVEMGTDMSWGRWPDGTGDWKILTAATPGESNEDPEIPEATLCINEFMADNSSFIEDPEEPGEYPDWIEIFNTGDETVELDGMFLSDDSADLTKYPIPSNVTIPAGGYLVFWADDEDEQGSLHTNFKLSKSNETIYLVSIDGETIIDEIYYSEQQVDISRGRYPDGTDNWSFMSQPSPGASNIPESTTGLSLMLNDTDLEPGDRFYLHFTLWPDDTTYNTDVYILLGVYGQYWCWPDWSDINAGISYQSFTVLPDEPIYTDILDFTWPDTGSSASGLVFYGAAMTSNTYSLIGELQIIEFGYK